MFVLDSNSAFQAASIGIDNITDFDKKNDKIMLSKSTFTALLSERSDDWIKRGEFASVSSDADASVSQSLIVYNKKNGHLFYNENGTLGGFGGGGLFAQLQGQPALSPQNLLIIA